MKHASHEWQGQVDRRFSEEHVAPKWTDMYASETEAPDEHFFRLRRDHAIHFALTEIRPEGVILDLGCGAAPVLTQLLKKGRKCVGMDHSLPMLENGRRRIAAHGIDVQPLVRGDSIALPFPDTSLDCVLCLGVISYLSDYSPLLAEVARVLKPEGKLMLTFRNMHRVVYSDPGEMLARVVRRQPLRHGHESGNWPGRFLDPLQVDEDVRSFGFKGEAFRGIGYGPLTIRGKTVLSDRMSIRISNGISSLVSSWKLSWPELWMTDVSVWTYAKPG